jgi:hypothetical protein
MLRLDAPSRDFRWFCQGLPCVAHCLTAGSGNAQSVDPTTPSAWRRRERSRGLNCLGWLEADVLRIVRDNGDLTARDFYEPPREPAHRRPAGRPL